jgi:hypothetical protein
MQARIQQRGKNRSFLAIDAFRSEPGLARTPPFRRERQKGGAPMRLLLRNVLYRSVNRRRRMNR